MIWWNINAYLVVKIIQKSLLLNQECIKVSDNDIRKLILLLRKSVFPYEYIDDWEKFKETSLPKKEEVKKRQI